MPLELSGKLFQVLPPQTGSGKNGAWTKQDFIIETDEQYPKKICVSAWGDQADLIQDASVGDGLKMTVIVESREYNNRWYTNLKVWNISNERSPKTKPKKEPSEEVKAAYMQDELDKEDDGLPF